MTREDWKINNLFTGNEQPLPRVDHSPYWSKGWEDGAEGYPKLSNFGMTEQEYRDYCEGFAAAESD
jgi:hypothetical protein